MAQASISDYSLVGVNSKLAVERGLAEAAWYQCPVPKETMRELLQRRNWPAVRDTVLWFGLLFAAGYLGFVLWGSWWAVPAFAVYGVIYGSTSDSRWHESSHGTAFKTDWMNNVLYEIASFMVMRESTLWRWSHTRHHSDTIIVGRDPEIAVPRPPDPKNLLLTFIGIPSTIAYFKKIARHCTGRLYADEATFVPEDQRHRVYLVARLHALIYLAVIGLAVYHRSLLPLMYVGLPNLYGIWLMPIYGYTQHAGLAENVLDHRLNCRTVYMNPIHRYLYWNMNYHVEHHMFPLVPYHNLPRLHELVKSDMPKPYGSILAAFREIVPTVMRQIRDPGYYIRRQLPEPADNPSHPVRAFRSAGKRADGLLEICAAEELQAEDVCRFDHEHQTFAVYRTADGCCYATDGICTHGRTHLAEGFVRGNLIECAKHNGRFDVRDGSPQRPPVCVGLRTYAVQEANGVLLLDLSSVGGAGADLTEQTHRLRVISNDNVATFIKELVLDPITDSDFSYTPGDYLQFDIPAYERISFQDLTVGPPFDSVWRTQHVYAYSATNPLPTRRNYSMASNPQRDRHLRFNVRIATPPRGQDCPAGIGSSYVWQLQPGDTITAIGPFGDFHLRDSDRELVFIGGGAGMAPLRAQLSYLFDTLKTTRRASYWYGARAAQEAYYLDYFEDLAAAHDNFSFHLALSDALAEDNWTGLSGYIHEVVKHEYLDRHAAPASLEYYLCGPPAMIAATRQMLAALDVPASQIAFDEF